MYTWLNRTFQTVAKVAVNFLDWQSPELYVGAGNFDALPKLIHKKNIESLLIVTDKGIRDTKIGETFTQNLEALGIAYAIYDGVESNPTTTISEEIAIQYKKIQAEAMVGVGGGSVIDAMKGASIAITQPEKPLSEFKGLLKVRSETPYMIAVPTTAGTGSEATLASVLSDPNGQDKYAIMDTALIPDLAILDSNLTESLPKDLIAGPGMDALTHAVEAYIGYGNTEETKKYSQEAITLIADNLLTNYENPGNAEARENMLIASYYAGKAFTRAYVGNVHAISHALSAYYNVPHGSTNATVLPFILRLYGDSAVERLAELSELVGLTEVKNTPKENAELFIEWIEFLNKKMQIRKHISEIEKDDLDGLADHAKTEANPLYPVPKIFKHDDFVEALRIIQG